MRRNYFKDSLRASRKIFNGLVTIFLYLIIEILKIFRFFAAYAAGLNKFARRANVGIYDKKCNSPPTLSHS